MIIWFWFAYSLVGGWEAIDTQLFYANLIWVKASIFSNISPGNNYFNDQYVVYTHVDRDRELRYQKFHN